MYWFRSESERFDPGIIYTQRNISDKDLERSCSYSLSVRDSSDAGLYYSAVVTCGSILFGEGTKVETREDSNPLVFVLGGLLALCVSVIFLLIFNDKEKNICQHHKGGELSVLIYTGKAIFNIDQSSHMINKAMDGNYAADKTGVRRGRWNKDLLKQCLYSTVTSDHGQLQLSSLQAEWGQ
ncbi:hypothetical protein ATANTOWER_024734 [Ataeniobius toweri]|uniref:Uncharacterized protein n=1 Tax=Ataeniobius toweri TaxID=208326 RepID=A0ABU7CLL0_9TELE|nr:hypothetical protein [Ataeniobius toweri]